MTDISDIELVHLYFKTQNVDYLGIVFKRYTRILLGVAMKYTGDLHDAEDVVQQVFIKFLENINPQIQNIGGWLYFVTKNESINASKKNTKNKYQQPIDSEFEIKDDSDFELDRLIEKEELAQQLREAISQLKDEQRIALNSFFFHKKSYEDIASDNNWTLNDVKSYIQNAKRNLKIKLEKIQKPY